MRIPCKAWPVNHPHPAFPHEKFSWIPVIGTRLIYEHSPPSRRIEAIVDSGAPYCLFHADVCKSLGIRRVEDGIRESLKGVVGGSDVPESPMYFHAVKVLIGSEQFETMAGFSWGLAVAGLLGRRGFFENFAVRFDCSVHPPALEIDRIRRA